MLSSLKDYNRAITHAGVFHGDDVMATAFIKMINPDLKVERAAQVPENLPEKVLVFDIGMGEFDHHQKDNEVRENGVPYAACGKLWRA